MYKNIDDEFDFCIIGTGIGGGMLLKELAAKLPNKSFLVIEAGGKSRKNEPHYVSKGLDFKMITTSIQVGGTSNLWHGLLGKLDPIDFKHRDWIPYSGWPIDLSDLQEYYYKATQFWGAEKPEYFSQKLLPQPLSTLFEDISFNRQLLKNKLFQRPPSVKSLRKYIIDIMKNNENITLLIQTTALELIAGDSLKTIKSCKVGLLDGSIKEVRAKTFILCTGALETPRIMLNSICFTNENIGKFLMDHPMGNLLQIKFKKPQKAPIYSDTIYGNGIRIKTGLVFTEETQETHQLPNHSFYIRPSFSKGIDDRSEKVKLSLLTYKSGNISLRDIWRVITNLNVVRQILTYKLSLNVTYKYADLFFMMEQVPSKKSFVGLSKEKDRYSYPKAEINWNLTEYDIENMKSVYKLCRENIFPKEQFEIIHGENDFNWPEIFTSGAHHVGTARMSKSDETGVVDSNLKVHCKENMYICDGSVFSTSGNVNIGLTISALAMRLAHHLTHQAK